MSKAICMYCGAVIDWEDSNNPSDDGLHNMKDKYGDSGNVCCGYCNTITWINRQFKRLIEHPEDFDLCLHHIEEAVQNLSDDKDGVVEHYQKNARKEYRKIKIDPTRVGRWIPDPKPAPSGHYTCSECGRGISFKPSSVSLDDFPYCICGARMENA